MLLCRNPQLVAGLVFVAPALPAKADTQGESFIWKASLGQQLQRLYFRALLQNDQAGLNYVRASIQKRSDQVQKGAEMPQVSPFSSRAATSRPSASSCSRPTCCNSG